MKRIISTLTLMIMVTGVSVFGQVKESADMVNQKVDIVINQKMIEKFRNAEYSENQVSFIDLFSDYSFETIKVLAQAYNSGEIAVASKDEINSYLARYEKENNQLELYSEKKTLASK